MKNSTFSTALKATIPVMAGYIILGTGFGLSMKNNGYSILMIFLMSAFIYAGSLQYLGINLLNMQAGIINTIVTSFAVNARHLFYGLSMANRYSDIKKHRNYIIFTLTDETYSLLCDGKLPDDKNNYVLYVSLLNHLYWITGSLLGGVIGELLPFNLAGIDFSMTALFYATLIAQWKNNRNHTNAITGLLASLVSILIFGKDNFLIPAMVLIFIVLTVLKGKLEGEHHE